MSGSGYKIRGHQRSRTDKPYNRPTSVVGKVKEWFSPSSWTNYFHTSSDTTSEQPVQSSSAEQVSMTQMSSLPPQSRQSLFLNRPRQSEALVSENTMVFTEQRATSSPSSNYKIGTGKKLFITPKYASNAPSSANHNSYQKKLTRDPVNDTDSAALPSHKVEGNSSNSSDVSWIAEDEGEEKENDNGDVSWIAGDEGEEKENDNGDVSWIAGDNEEEEKVESGTDIVSHRVNRPVFISLVSERLHSASEDVPASPFAYDIGEGKAGVTESSAHLVTPSAEVDVERVANPVFIVPYSNELKESDVYRNRPQISSTVTRLNNEQRKNLIDSTMSRLSHVRREATSSPSQIHSHLLHHPHDDSLSQSTARITTPSGERSQRLGKPSFSVLPFLSSPSSSMDTTESIKQSPFHSPFYSGKTAFGGAASGQRLRLKRPRPDSNPPSYIQHQVTVRPTNERDNTQPVVSQTAKRILSSLQTNHSPLSDARKMPMRHMPTSDDDQPTKRRRVTNLTTPRSTTTPPPVTPFYSSSHEKLSRLHPSSRHEGLLPYPGHQVTSTHRKTISSSSVVSSGSPIVVSSSSAPLLSPTFGVNIMSSGTPPSRISGSLTPMINFSNSSSSTPKHSAILSGLKFTPAPPAQEVGGGKISGKEKESSSRRDRDSPTQDISGNKVAGRITGKMRVGRRNAPLHESRKSRVREEEEVDAFINPLAPPPSVGLSFGKVVPEIKFHTQALPKFSTISTPPNTTITASIYSSYSFSHPKSITDLNTMTEVDHQVSSFGFTIPKSHMHVTASPRTSPVLSITAIKTKETEPQMLSDLPAHSLGVHPVIPPKIIPRPKEPKQVLPLISGSVEDMFKDVNAPQKSSTEPSKLVSTPSPVIPHSESQNKPVVSSVSIEKPVPPPSNASLKALFAPPSSSWECDTCMLNNKSEVDKCVACYTPKPGLKKDIIPKPLGNTGALKINISLSAPGSSANITPIQPLPLFSQPAGSWSCDTCLVDNKAESKSCVACSTPKPGETSSGSKLNPVAIGGNEGLKFGSSGGFKLGSNTLKPLDSTTLKVGDSGGFKIGVTGGLKIGGSYLGLKIGDSGGLKFGDSGGLKIGDSGGLKFGDSGGLKIGGSGGLKIGGSGGLKIGADSGGLKTEGINSGGLKVGGVSGAMKIGDSGGLKIGAGGLKMGGDSGGLKIGADSGGLKTEGIKIGSVSGGLKIGSNSGTLKIGGDSGRMKIGGDNSGVIGDSGVLKISGSSGTLKMGDNPGAPKIGDSGGIKIGGNSGGFLAGDDTDSGASMVKFNPGSIISGAGVDVSGGFKASGAESGFVMNVTESSLKSSGTSTLGSGLSFGKIDKNKETGAPALLIGGPSPLVPASQQSSLPASGLGSIYHGITSGGNNKPGFDNQIGAVVSSQLKLPPSSLSSNIFAGAATFNFSGGKSNLGQTSSVNTGTGFGITPQTNPVTTFSTPFKFSATSSQASSSSTFGGISVSSNPQNIKLGEGFNFSPASQKSVGPGLFGKAVSSAPFQFSGSNVSTLTSATSNPIQSNIFSANPVMNFGAQGPSTLKSGLFGSQKDQSSTTQLGIRTTESHQPSLSFNNPIQPLGGNSSMDMMDNNIQQKPNQFQFGQSTTATTTSNQGYNFNSGQGMNFNFNSPISSTNPLFSGNTNAPDISKRVIRKATRRKKT